MTDSYHAIYDAVRSRISNGDVGRAVADVARSSFDISHVTPLLQQEIYAVGYELRRPSVVFRPNIFPDGDQWCALLGDNLMEGVSGFGNTPEAAATEFDKAWYGKITPQAEFARKSEP